MAEPQLDVAEHERPTGIGSLVRRGLWIGSNLVVGYYATFGTLLILLVWVDDELTGVLIRSLCTIVGLGILIGIGTGLNGLLRLFNRDACGPSALGGANWEATDDAPARFLRPKRFRASQIRPVGRRLDRGGPGGRWMRHSGRFC